jgi:hypothetical protein
VQFDAAARDALVQILLEARRPLEWLEHDRAQYWPREVRKAADAVAEARLALDRCQISISGDDQRSCYDERKALEKARRRLALAEEKVGAVRRWRVEMSQELEAFDVEASKLQHFLEFDLSRAMAVLDRMAESLDQYLEQPRTGAIAPPPQENP